VSCGDRVQYETGGKKVPASGPPWSFPEELDDVRGGLRKLLDLYRSAHQTVGVYHARTSHAWATAKPEKRRADTRDSWVGGFESTGERDYAPGYNRLLAGDETFLDPGDPDHERFVGIAEAILEAMGGRVAREEAP
jgi:exonuclease V gamma subunit